MNSIAETPLGLRGQIAKALARAGVAFVEGDARTGQDVHDAQVLMRQTFGPNWQRVLLPRKHHFLDSLRAPNPVMMHY